MSDEANDKTETKPEQELKTCRARLRKGLRKGQPCGRPLYDDGPTCYSHSAVGMEAQRAQGKLGGRPRPKQPRTSDPNLTAQIQPFAPPEDYQDVIARAAEQASMAALGIRAAEGQEQERRWLKLILDALSARDAALARSLEARAKLRPLVIRWEGRPELGSVPIAAPPAGASDDPIGGVVPLPVRQGA